MTFHGFAALAFATECFAFFDFAAAVFVALLWVAERCATFAFRFVLAVATCFAEAFFAATATRFVPAVFVDLAATAVCFGATERLAVRFNENVG